MSRQVLVRTKLLASDRELIEDVARNELDLAVRATHRKDGRLELRLGRGDALVRLEEDDGGALGVSGIEERVASQRDVVARLARAVARRKVVALAERAGFRVVRDETDLRGRIRLEVARWV